MLNSVQQLMADDKMDKNYDIVLLGATGYTGRLTAAYMDKALPADVKWAVAGRNEAKLQSLSNELGLGRTNTRAAAVYALDLASAEEIAQLAKSTRVIVNVIGPYGSTCGPAVVKACAEAGTDYVDCGDVPWIQDMIQKHETTAQESGAKIIFTSGWTAVPADLSTLLAAQQIRTSFSAPTREVLVSLDALSGSFSGGSINSLCDAVETYGAPRIAASCAPFALSPKAPIPTAPEGVLPGMGASGVQRVGGMGTLAVSTQEQAERATVGRSWGLYDADEGYGKDFFFSSRMRMSNAFTAWAFSILYSLFKSLLAFAPFRTLIAKYLFPAGTGPSAKSRGRNFFKYRTVGVADTEDAPKKRTEVTFEYDGDPYVFTGVALAEAALLLLEGGTEAHRRGGGMMTPAMLGEKYAERLKRPEAGVKIEVNVIEG